MAYMKLIDEGKVSTSVISYSSNPGKGWVEVVDVPEKPEPEMEYDCRLKRVVVSGAEVKEIEVQKDRLLQDIKKEMEEIKEELRRLKETSDEAIVKR